MTVSRKTMLAERALSVHLRKCGDCLLNLRPCATAKLLRRKVRHLQAAELTESLLRRLP